MTTRIPDEFAQSGSSRTEPLARQLRWIIGLRLVIDLADSLCLEKFRGPPVDLGTLTAFAAPTGGPKVALGVVPKVQYSLFGFENGASICELALTDEQLTLIRSAPLELHTSR